MNADALLCFCRAGFEPEPAAELTERAADAGFAGYARTQRGSGYVEFVCHDAAALDRDVEVEAQEDLLPLQADGLIEILEGAQIHGVLPL